MSKNIRLTSKTVWNLSLFVVLWALTIWLLYPLLSLQSLESWDAGTFTVRSIIGIGIMILLFGKTMFDIFFPLDTSKEMSWLQTIFLTIYATVLAVGILYLAGRLIVIFFKAENVDVFS